MNRSPRTRILAFAALLAGVWLCAAPAQAGNKLSLYNDPLVYGMTRDQVERLVEAPLVYLSGPPGSERFIVERMSGVPGIYPVDTRIILQFRNGRLTGWRRDFQMRPYWW